MTESEVILFISKESATYHFTVRLIQTACERVSAMGDRKCRVRLFHIEDDPESAEQYNIEALPTLIVGRRRFIGTPTAESLQSLVDMVAGDSGQTTQKT